MSLISPDSTTVRAHHDAAGMRVSERLMKALKEAAQEQETARQKGASRGTELSGRASAHPAQAQTPPETSPLGRSRGGLTSKIHFVADRRCRPLTAGQAGAWLWRPRWAHHRSPDRAGPAPAQVSARAPDSDPHRGGGTHEFVNWLAARGRRLSYSVGMTITEAVHQAVLLVPASPWTRPSSPAAKFAMAPGSQSSPVTPQGLAEGHAADHAQGSGRIQARSCGSPTPTGCA